jgi:predicted transcriptional regulator
MAHTPTRQDAKVAVTIRLDPVRVRQLQAVAEAENRSLTNYVETALLRDLAQRDEASRVITMLAARGWRSRLLLGRSCAVPVKPMQPTPSGRT